MDNKQDNTHLLSDNIKQQIDVWVNKYPADKKQSAVLSALTIVQDNNEGWLSRNLIDAVADYLQMPRVAAYEVATFYSMFDLQKVGRHKIKVCCSISCKLRGSDKLLNHLKKRLDVSVGGTTHDGRFTLKHVECLGACVGAPVVQVNEQYHENLTESDIDRVLDGLK